MHTFSSELAAVVFARLETVLPHAVWFVSERALDATTIPHGALGRRALYYLLYSLTKYLTLRQHDISQALNFIISIKLVKF